MSAAHLTISGGCHGSVGLEGCLATQYHPSDAGEFVGQRHDHRVAMLSVKQVTEPRAQQRLASGRDGMAALGPWISSVRWYLLPRLGDAEQPGFAAGGMLPGYEPQPCAEIKGSCEGRAVPYSGDDSGGIESTDTGERRQAPSTCIVAGQFDELPIQSLDAAVEIKPFLPHRRKQAADAAGHEVRIGEQCHSLLELAASLCDSSAALQQNGAQLVGQRRARAHQP